VSVPVEFEQKPDAINVFVSGDEVHVRLDGVPDAPVVLVKLKSPEAVDVLIDALQTHRKRLWGEPSLTSWIRREQAKRDTPESRARFNRALADVQAIFREEEEAAHK
jgi:ABC-type taurine transport system substrate-binding protein